MPVIFSFLLFHVLSSFHSDDPVLQNPSISLLSIWLKDVLSIHSSRSRCRFLSLSTMGLVRIERRNFGARQRMINQEPYLARVFGTQNLNSDT
ncbi:hypothetical protein B0O80DRAFT_140900 [Mortierella sp. GBAus27b]|nr:hypothetical protein B0O80DRAFT_140900 [Mortierella sp. GBAus27b]